MNKLILRSFLVSVLSCHVSHVAAASSGALSLLEPSSAKFSALGGASTAAENEVSSFNENPATLQSLQSNQAMFMYQKGALDESYGRFMIGSPRKNNAWGLSVGYYNAGDIDLNDGNGTRTVAAQKDLALTLGGSHRMGRFDLGLAGKYFRSELVEAYQATAYAADFGLAFNASSRLRLGGAMQNIGTKVTYVTEGDNLPRIARLGASYALRPGNNYPSTLFLDAPYYMNERELQPAIGLEVAVGPMAIRTGFRHGGGTNEFSVGTGFMISKMSLDYSFGMRQDLDAVQRFSLSMRFAGANDDAAFVKKKEDKRKEEVAQVDATETAAPAPKRHTLSGKTASVAKTTPPVRKSVAATRRVYTVQAGDTLATIAKKEYGTASNWQMLYYANKHLIIDPRNIEVGQKIVLP